MSLSMSSIATLVVAFGMAYSGVRAEASIPADLEEEAFVRRQTSPDKIRGELGTPELWEQFVRHENPAKAKRKFDNDLTDGLMLEVLIAVFGFACTIGIQAFLRMKKKQLNHPNPRARTSKHAAERSATSMSGGATSGGRNRVPHPEDCGDAFHEEKPIASSGGANDACNTCEKRESRPHLGTDADAFKKIAKVVSSRKVDDLAHLLNVSLTSIERANLPLAGPKITTEAVMVLLRSCAALKCFEEAIAVYDRLESRIGLGSRQFWSLLLYIGTEAGAYNRCEGFYAKLRAGVGDAGPSGRDLVNIIRKLARQNDLSGLRAILDDLKNLTSYEQYDRLIRNRALAACYKEGATELADCIANSPIFSAPLDIVGFNTLITCYSRAGLYEKCFATFDGMEANGVAPTQATFGSLMEACVGSEDWERARSFCNKLLSYGIVMNAQHYTILIKGLVKQNRLKEAEQLLKDMSHTADLRLDVVAFYTLLRAYTDVGDSDGAERVYTRMIHQGVLPDEYVCNALIHSCTVTKMHAEYINSILERSIAANIQPSATTLSLMLKAFALCKDFHAGLELLKSSVDRFGMSKAEPRLFVQFAQAAIKAGEKAKAREVHDVMVKALSDNGQDSYKAASRWLLRQCERA